MDAFTSKEYTCFYAKVLDDHLSDAVDLLSDIVLRPLFDATELERERKVIVEEIRMVEDAPEELVYDLFSTHFYPGHALGRPIQGTEETVGGLSRRRLLDYFRANYVPHNILIVAAGNLRHATLARLAAKSFGRMPRGGAQAPSRRAAAAARRHRHAEQERAGAAPRAALGVPAFPERHAQRYPLFVLNALLGGTMSSRLFQKVREERGLAYSVYSAVNAFRDAGVMMVYAGTSPDKGDELLSVVRDELRDLRDKGPSAREVEVAKEHLKGSLMLSLESTSSRMSNLARQEMYHGRTFSMTRDLRRSQPRDAERTSIGWRARSSGRERPRLAAVGRTRTLKAIREGFAL